MTKIIDVLARELNACVNDFSYAGRKDKVAVTTQKIVVNGIEPHEVARLEVEGKIENVELGNFSYATNSMQAGELHGNRFEITLRDVNCSKSLIEAAVKEVRQNGFANYYGPQRFGENGHVLGRLLLQKRWAEFVDILFTPVPRDGPVIRDAKLHWLAHRNPYAQELKPLRPFFRGSERLGGKLVQGMKKFARYGEPVTDDILEKAIMTLPYDVRWKFIQAYTSYVFNHSMSDRLKTGSPELEVGDLITTDTSKPAVSNKNVERLGHAYFSDPIYSMENLVLPLAGHVRGEAIPCPILDRLLEQDGLSREAFELDNLGSGPCGVFVPTAHRYVLTYPEGVELTNFGDNSATFAFNLRPGSYATVFLRELQKESLKLRDACTWM